MIKLFNKSEIDIENENSNPIAIQTTNSNKHITILKSKNSSNKKAIMYIPNYNFIGYF